MTTATHPLPTLENLPEELTKYGVKRWIIWRNENGGKVPYQPRAPQRKASSTTPEHWTFFTGALIAAQRSNSGVGFVFTESDGYVGVDLDDCLNERGELTPWAAEILRLAGETYSEVSPSGRGVKIWLRGSLPGGKGVKHTLPGGGGVEAYSTGRYFTVTGQRWKNAPPVIGDGTQAINYILSLAQTAVKAHTNGHTNGVRFPAVAPAPDGGAAGIMLTLIEKVRNAPEGNRNNELNKAGYTFGGLLASGAIGVNERNAYTSMLYNAAVKAGLPGEEALTTLEHSIERGWRQPFTPDDWDAPAPLPDDDAPVAPEFPLHILPNAYRQYIEGIAAETQTDSAMAATAGLAVISGALCGTMRIAVRRGAHIEQPGLYVAIVAPTGERKSVVLRRLLEPVIIYERSERKRVQERDQRLKALRGELAEAKRAKDDAKVAELQNRVRDLENECERALSRELLVSDATSQALSAMLNRTGGRALVASAEGDIVEHVGGRYNDGNPDLNVYLSGYSADPLRVLRKERNEFIEAPSLAVVQMMQPARLREFLRIPTVIQRGLAARMLFVTPQSRLGERTYYAPHVSRDVKDRVEAAMQNLLNRDVTAYDGERAVLLCSPEAERVFEAWHYEIEPLLARDDLDDMLKGWLARGVGHAVRLAAVIYELRVVLGEADAPGGFHLAIGEEDAHAGVTLAKYYFEHLKAALSAGQSNEDVETARAVINWFASEERTEVTAREVYRKFHGRLSMQSTQDARRVLELLEEYGYVRKGEENRRVGRPSEQWRVNPRIFAEREA